MYGYAQGFWKTNIILSCVSQVSFYVLFYFGSIFSFKVKPILYVK